MPHFHMDVHAYHNALFPDKWCGSVGAIL